MRELSGWERHRLQSEVCEFMRLVSAEFAVCSSRKRGPTPCAPLRLRYHDPDPPSPRELWALLETAAFDPLERGQRVVVEPDAKLSGFPSMPKAMAVPPMGCEVPVDQRSLDEVRTPNMTVGMAEAQARYAKSWNHPLRPFGWIPERP